MKFLSIISNFYLAHFAVIHKGIITAKLKSCAIIGFTISPMVLLLEFLGKWTLDNSLYISAVSLALIADLFIGIVAHLFYFRDFNSRQMTVKFLEKLFCTYIGLIIFELFGILFIQYNVEMGDYLKLSIALTVLSYPALSAFGNLSVITKGKFPPTIWIEKLTQFNRTGNIKEFKNKEKREND